jgi:hypothetical protein
MAEFPASWKIGQDAELPGTEGTARQCTANIGIGHQGPGD